MGVPTAYYMQLYQYSPAYQRVDTHSVRSISPITTRINNRIPNSEQGSAGNRWHPDLGRRIEVISLPGRRNHGGYLYLATFSNTVLKIGE